MMDLMSSHHAIVEFVLVNSVETEKSRKPKKFLTVSVEGKNLTGEYHATLSPDKHQIVNHSGWHVTKIELELKEAPDDDAILIESMPSELNVTDEINTTCTNGIPGPTAVIVRAEEALIVILVLLLWAAAIALFFNRWGKIRMLEPYQPKFQQQHRQSCTTIEQNQVQVTQNRRTFSKCNILCGDYPTEYEFNCTSGQTRPRQNSVFIGSSASLLPGSQGTPRRTKSAFDLQFLILSENNAAPDSSSSGEQEAASRSFKPLNESTRLLLRERKASVCQWDRTEVAKPPIRDQRMSICQFDRMDVMARSLQRDRVGSAYHFDRMDVLARPNLSHGRSLTRERRVSTCSFLEKDEETTRDTRLERRVSGGNVEMIEKEKMESEDTGRRETFAKCTSKAVGSFYQLDQPSCSKNSDTVFGYKATCV